MTRCAHCFASCDGIFCSLGCASERYALMLEGVRLLDELMRLVDDAAKARGAMPPGLAPRPQVAARASVKGEAEHSTAAAPLFDPVQTAVPNGLDPAGRNG